MYSVNQLSVSFSGIVLFDEVSFLINARDRVGLVGKNGAGKTTLMRILHKEMEPEKGSVAMPQGSISGYLPQEMDIQSSRSVKDEALMAFDRVNRIKQEILSLEEKIQTQTDVHEASYLKNIDKLHQANESFAMLGGNTMLADTEKVLLGLGFEPGDMERSMSEFSGGWKMRVELAKILLSKPDLLLLDEPTNHLDIESIQWLEEFLESYPGAVLMVSHDRAFLDNVTERTIELSLGKVNDYKACYSDYMILRQERQEQQMAAYSNQQKHIDQIERFVTRFRYKSTKSRQVQSKLKYLNKLERVEVDETDASAIHFRFPDAPHSGKIIMEVHNAGKSFGAHQVLHNINFTLIRGEKIAFVGKNGEGKTTLSRMIIGELDYEGEIRLGHLVKIGYFAQNQAELLDMNKTVFQTIDDAATGDMRPKVRGLLGSFLFGQEALDKKVKVLSGGEKSRLALAKLLLQPVNLLILDEPTNHLDMISKDILKNALLKYDGTLIIVSHDRDFLQGLTNKVFEVRKQNIREYIGDVYDFLDSRKLASLKELEVQKKKNAGNPVNEEASGKLSWEKRKELDRDLRKFSNRIQKCEDEIAKTEEQIAHLDNILSNPHDFQDQIIDEAFYSRYRQAKEQLEVLFKDWESLHNQLEVLKGEGM